MTGVYRIAGLTIRIDSLYSEVHTMCAPYRKEGPVDFSIATTHADIDFESTPPHSFPDSYLETLAAYRKIAEKLPRYDAFLMHGSCIAVDGCAYVFSAKSGTGKSTHTALWRKLLGDRAVMVNDDKPIVRSIGGCMKAFGSPWDGKHHLSSDVSFPLKAICFLERSETNRIITLSRADALPLLVRHVYRPSDPSALEKTMGLLGGMDIGFYRLYCNMEMDAANLSYSEMSGSEVFDNEA